MFTSLTLKVLLLLDVVLDLVSDELLVSRVEAEVEGDSNIGLLSRIDVGVNDLAGGVHRNRHLRLQGEPEPEHPMSTQDSRILGTDDQSDTTSTEVGQLCGELGTNGRKHGLL